jgi:hypothetical protein
MVGLRDEGEDVEMEDRGQRCVSLRTVGSEERGDKRGQAE